MLVIVFKYVEESISSCLALQNWIRINLYFLVLNYTNSQGKQKYTYKTLGKFESC
jgi:hypothetical protein